MKKLEIIGYLAEDAKIVEKTIADGGNKFLAFKVGVSFFTRHNEEQTEWYNCTYNPNENLLPYLKKGTQIFLRGMPSVEANEKDNKIYLNHKLFVKELQLLSSNKKEKNQDNNTSLNGSNNANDIG